MTFIRKHLPDLILALPFLWVGISIIDSVMHQFSGGSDSAWNLFNIIIRIGEMMHGA